MKYHNKILLLIAAIMTFPLVGCSEKPTQSQNPALFETRVEAEAAAKNFNCTGAHKMGDQWMPCENHKNHDQHKKHVGHGPHHNH